MDWITTSVMLDRLQEVDDTAWSGFVDRFRSPLVAYARRAGLNEEEAEDAAQETLLAFARDFRAGRYERSQGRLHSWLFGIARNRVIDVTRRRRSRELPAGQDRSQTGFWNEVPEDAPSQESFDRDWKQSVFEACLAQVRRELQPETVRAFELVVLEERSPSEAAEELGLTSNAVSVAKHRVLTRLRERTREYEDVSGL